MQDFVLKGHKEPVDFSEGLRGRSWRGKLGPLTQDPIPLVWVGWLLSVSASIMALDISAVFDVSLACELSPDPQSLHRPGHLEGARWEGACIGAKSPK